MNAAAIVAGLVVAALRGLLAAGVVAAALACCPRLPARQRQRTWSLLLYAALAMPLAGGLAPQMVLPWPRAFSAAVPAAAPAPRSAADRPASLTLAAAGARAPIPAPPRPSPSRPANWAALALALYLAVMGLLLLRLGLGWRLLRRLAASASPLPEGPARQALVRLAPRFGLDPPPRLGEAAALAVPLTLGLRHPVILLPAACRDGGAQQLEAVVAHELAHIAHGDLRRQAGALAYRAAFWFSPLAWWLPRHLARLAEDASDAAALAAGADPAALARQLLQFSAALGATPGRARWPALALAESSPARRIRQILDWTPVAAPSRLAMSAGACALGAALGLCALVKLAPRAAAPRPQVVRLSATFGPLPAAQTPAPPRVPHAAAGKLAWIWTRAYVGQPSTRLLEDTQSNSLFGALVPDGLYHYHLDMPLAQAVATLLRGPGEPVELRDGRYLTFSAQAPNDGSARAWIWLDLGRGEGGGALLSHPTNAAIPSPNLTLFSRTLAAPPAAMLADFDAWAAAHQLPTPMATYFVGPGGATNVLLHAATPCRGPLDTQLCEALNLDRANADLAAALYLLRHSFASPNSAAAATLQTEQDAWLAQRQQSCAASGERDRCLDRITRIRIRTLTDTLLGLRASANGPHAELN